MEADFDIDAAFDEVVDRFVSEYVPVMKKIDAIDGLPDKVKSAWKNILLTVQKPGKLQVATRRGLSPSARGPGGICPPPLEIQMQTGPLRLITTRRTSLIKLLMNTVKKAQMLGR